MSALSMWHRGPNISGTHICNCTGRRLQHHAHVCYGVITDPARAFNFVFNITMIVLSSFCTHLHNEAAIDRVQLRDPAGDVCADGTCNTSGCGGCDDFVIVCGVA